MLWPEMVGVNPIICPLFNFSFAFFRDCSQFVLYWQLVGTSWDIVGGGLKLGFNDPGNVGCLVWNQISKIGILLVTDLVVISIHLRQLSSPLLVVDVAKQGIGFKCLVLELFLWSGWVPLTAGIWEHKRYLGTWKGLKFHFSNFFGLAVWVVLTRDTIQIRWMRGWRWHRHMLECWNWPVCVLGCA